MVTVSTNRSQLETAHMPINSRLDEDISMWSHNEIV